MTREEAEDARQAKLIDLRKKYLDSKGIISKARPSAKVKLTGLDKVEAEREAKLVALREKYLAKKRAVTKSVVPTARKMDTATKKKPSSGTGRSKVLGTEKYIAKGNRTGTTKPTLKSSPYIAKGKRTASDKPTYEAKGKRTGNIKPTPYVAKGKRTGNIKPSLAPTKSVRPIARITTTDPKKEQGYFVNKKKGNAMVRVFPNISPALYGRMSAKERKALNLPSPNSTKYTVDFNQRNALTFIIKK